MHALLLWEDMTTATVVINGSMHIRRGWLGAEWVFKTKQSVEEH
jgi:hypothetical protein